MKVENSDDERAAQMAVQKEELPVALKAVLTAALRAV